LPTLKINPDGLERLRSQLGSPTNDALARRMKVDSATVSRVLSGKSTPGARFIAGALLAFGTAWIGELFQVVEK
jgi:transcriptional regulator with XRE-family HTH domain